MSDLLVPGLPVSGHRAGLGESVDTILDTFSFTSLLSKGILYRFFPIFGILIISVFFDCFKRSRMETFCM